MISKNIRVGLDCSNGSSSAIAKSVFDASVQKTYVINNDPDGTNINTNCGSLPILRCFRDLLWKKVWMGFAYDGDADRCIAVDHRGNIIDGDKIMYVCGKYLREQGRLNGNTVVTTVMSNMGLYKALEREGISYEQTAVGDKYVAENMLEKYTVLEESSPDILYSAIFSNRRRNPYFSDADGGLRGEKKTTLCDLAKEMKVYPQILRSVRVADKVAARENPKVKRLLRGSC